MKFALLGADVDSLELTTAATAAGHALIWQGDLAGADRAPGPCLARVDQHESWEDLFDGEAVDFLIVGRGGADPQLRARQVQELARLGQPMLTTFPLFDSVLTYFEVDMVRDQSGVALRHYNPLTESPAIEEMAHRVCSGDPRLGTVEQVACIRQLANRTRVEVLRRFARDVELAERLVGRLDRVGAHGASNDDAAYSALSVQLLGASGLPVRWTVEPPAARESLRVTIVCPHGRATVEFDAQDQALARTLQNDQGNEAIPIREDSTAGAAISRFVAAINGGADAPAERSTWPAALHAMELADSIEISLRRGRMIDVHAQQLTEELAFKGTMAAAGCGVLLVLAPLALVAGWIAGLLGVPVANYWPHALLAILVAFLSIQLLPKLLLGLGKASKRN